MSMSTLVLALGPLSADGFAVVSLAATWVLIALGLHVTFGMLGVVNLAHGEFLLVGAYVALLAHALTGSVLLGVLLAGPVTAMLGWLTDRLVLRRLGERLLDTLLATFGVGIVLRQGIQLVAGPNLRTLPDPIGRSLLLGPLVVPAWRLTLTGLTLLLTLALWLVLTRTRTGILWRAVTSNPTLAATLGADVLRARTLLFALGAGLTGLAGAILAPLASVSPQFGTRFLVPAFVVVILGGAGSLGGLVLAGVVLGGGLGVLQFFIDPVSAQIAVLLLAIVLLRSARRGARGGPLEVIGR
jgi:urea transport system permease protein